MERVVYDEQLDIRFRVDMKDVAKQRKGLTFSNAASCCSTAEIPVPLVQVKKCGKCSKDVDATQCTHKIWKRGKVSVLVPAEKLEQIDDAMEQQDELRIKASLSGVPQGFFERVGSTVRLAPSKKDEAEYAMFCERFKAAPYAVGTGVFRGSQYEFVAWLGDDGAVRLTKLVEQAQFYGVDEQLSLPPVDVELKEMVQQLIGELSTAEYDFTQFADSGIAMKQALIERIALGQELPEFRPAVEEQKKDDLKARLKARLEAKR